MAGKGENRLLDFSSLACGIPAVCGPFGRACFLEDDGRLRGILFRGFGLGMGSCAEQGVPGPGVCCGFLSCRFQVSGQFFRCLEVCLHLLVVAFMRASENSLLRMGHAVLVSVFP